MSHSIFVKGSRADSHADIAISVINAHSGKTVKAGELRIKEAPPKELVRATADVINDRICKFFNVRDESDKTLFRSIFFQSEVDKFYFCKMGDKEICHVALTDLWQDLCTVPKANDFPQPKDNGKLKVVVVDKQSKSSQEWGYSDISKVCDLPTVALYNSLSFQGYSEVIKDLGWSRTLEKLSLAPISNL